MNKVKLGEVATECRETYRGDKSGIPIVGLEHLIPENIELSQWSVDSENTFTKSFKAGQVLFGRRRAYLKKAAVAPVDGICSGDITVIDSKPEYLSQRLLPFIIQNDDFFDYAVGKSAGSLSPRVKWEHLKNYEFNLPDMDEQNKLADVLWAIEETKRSYKKLLIKTDELVKSQFIEMFGDIANNPKCYEKVPFKELCYAMGDGLHGTPKYDDNGEFYFINGNNLREKSIVITSETRRINKAEYERLFINMDEKTVLLSINGTLGNTGFYNGEPVALGKSACYCNLGQRLIREFVQGLFASDMFQEFMDMSATGTTIRNFGLKALREYKMIVPPIEEQEEYKKFVEQSDKSKFELEKTIKELEMTYKRIIKEKLG